MLEIQKKSERLNYQDGKQSAVWFPFFPEASYDPEKRNNCETYLVFKKGLPKAIVCPNTHFEQNKDLALNPKVFHDPPPVIISYNAPTLEASIFQQGTYSKSEYIPNWDQLDDYASGCLSELRAEEEISAIRNRMSNWLRDPYSKAAVEMRKVTIRTVLMT